MRYYRHTDLLLALLRLALWDDRASIAELQPISQEEWSIAFKLAAQHAVVGIAWQGLSKLGPDQLPPDDLLCIWTAKAEAIEAASARMNTALGALLDYLRSHDLHPVVMKGQAAAALYSKPLLRETGDIDLFFPDKAEFRRALSLLPSYAIAPDGSARAHYQGVEVDMHHRLIDICNPLAQSAVLRLMAQSPYAQIEYAPGMTLTAPNAAITLTMLSTHIMKHIIGRGIGLRQMCDMAMACAAYGQAVDAAQMEATSRALGLHRWDRLIYSFLLNELKMPRAYLPYPVTEHKSRALTDRVIAGGNFGRAVYPPISGNAVKQKGVTAYALLKNSLWSLRFTPMESIFTFLKLAAGQLRRRK